MNDSVFDVNAVSAKTWDVCASPVPTPEERARQSLGRSFTAVCSGWLDPEDIRGPSLVGVQTPAELPLTAGGIEKAFLHAARGMLLDAEAGEEIAWHARSRLAVHGFGWNELIDLPLGLIVTRRLMFAELRRAFPAAEIRRSRLLSDPRLPGRIVGPICDVGGAIVSFWARDPDDHAPRHLFLDRHWRRIAPLVGLETALVAAAGNRHGLVVVEDPLCSLLLRSRGLANVAAIAGPGGDLSARCWLRLAELGVDRVTLVLNHHPEAAVHLAAARENHRRAGVPLELFFVLPERLAPWDTPAELVRSRGVEAFLALLDHAWGLALTDGDAAEEPETPPAATVEPAGTMEPVSPIESVEPPRSPVPARPAQRGECLLHRCGETDCFCFD